MYPRTALITLVGTALAAGALYAQETAPPGRVPTPPREALGDLPRTAVQPTTNRLEPVNRLEQSHQQFRDSVVQTLQNATGAAQQIEVDDTTITSIANGVVVAGAPYQPAAPRDDIDRDPVRDPVDLDDGEDARLDQARSDRSMSDATSIVGIVIVSDARGGERARSRAGVDVPRRDETKTRFGDDIRRVGDRALKVSSGEIPSGVFTVRTYGRHVQLFSRDDDSLKATIPLIELRDPMSPEPRENESIGLEGTEQRRDANDVNMDQAIGSENAAAIASDEYGESALDWQRVFASIVCALESDAARKT